MTAAKLTSKGQITVPKSVRDDLGLRTGDEVEFVKTNGGYQLRKRFAESPFAPFRGILRKRMLEMGYRTTDEFIEDIRGR